jgi:hypothetical protein
MRTLTIISAIAALALATAITARATAPTTTHTSFHRAIPNYLPCPGFTVRGEFDIERTTTTFYDDAGIAIRTVSHVHSDGTLSNPLTHKSIADSGDFKVSVDLATDELTMEGKVNMATSPGGGVVYQSVGRLVLGPDGVEFEAGPHDDADGDFDALCSFLGSA